MNGEHHLLIDPAQKHLGTVYAKALLGAAENAGNAEQVLSELDSLIHDVIGKLPQFEAALTSPRVGVAEKEALLDRALSGKVSPQLLIFLKVVARHGRLDALRAIRVVAGRLLNEMRGRVEVQLHTASPMDSATRQSVQDRLRTALGREVDLREQVDPELLGGMQIRIGDTVYDASLATQLDRWRDSAVNKMADQARVSLGRFLQDTDGSNRI